MIENFLPLKCSFQWLYSYASQVLCVVSSFLSKLHMCVTSWGPRFRTYFMIERVTLLDSKCFCAVSSYIASKCFLRSICLIFYMFGPRYFPMEAYMPYALWIGLAVMHGHCQQYKSGSASNKLISVMSNNHSNIIIRIVDIPGIGQSFPVVTNWHHQEVLPIQESSELDHVQNTV